MIALNGRIYFWCDWNGSVMSVDTDGGDLQTVMNRGQSISARFWKTALPLKLPMKPIPIINICAYIMIPEPRLLIPKTAPSYPWNMRITACWPDEFCNMHAR